MKKAIGQLKVTTKVYCEVCGISHSRKLVENVFENTPEAIKVAKDNLTTKASKKYTCNICKSILKNVNND